ncbi:uncharacterized protein LOC129581748 isoform X2 [Paramacrobiotus metropolitanus]|uniref:uncharacterized protein LOC129581748 isoform X2 n=1 Tax=Paramacrobiotus metropolitanus TaxID=2943436 RepID=UPI00244563E1|nr:uncharacterized protein LOC129581748 isoform X2 [Paramacrobiotus metropolitanus]
MQHIFLTWSTILLLGGSSVKRLHVLCDAAERTECPFPTPCYAWLIEHTCSFGIANQPNSSDCGFTACSITACSGWYNAYKYYCSRPHKLPHRVRYTDIWPHIARCSAQCVQGEGSGRICQWSNLCGRLQYPFQFDLVVNSSASGYRAILAVSRCTRAPLTGTVDRNDSVAVLRSTIISNPYPCRMRRVRFWYHLSDYPVFDSVNPQNQFHLKVFAAELTGIAFPTDVIWGREEDYNGVRPNVWYQSETLFHRANNGPFFIYLFAYHNDNCQANVKTITLDYIDIAYAVLETNAARCPSTTTTPMTMPPTTHVRTVSTNSMLSQTPAVALSASPKRTTKNPTTPTTSLVTAAAPTITTTGAATTPSSIFMELQTVTNIAAYPNKTSYYTQSTHNVLNAIRRAVTNETIEFTFNDIVTTANFFQEFAEQTDTPNDLPEGAEKDAISTLLQITDQIVIAEESGKVAAVTVEKDGQDAASTIYQALENMYNSLPPTEEPYVFNTTFSVTYAHVVQINASSQFDDWQFKTKLEIAGFIRGAITIAGAEENAASVATIEFKDDVLREAFEELKQTANDSCAKFTFSLSAMPAFKFAKYIPVSQVRQRSSPLVLLASVGYALKQKDIVIIRHNVDRLFNYPSGARRQQQCTFLNYTTKQWSGDGCRVSAKYPKWNDTVVECTCDHLTPFSLLLTLCGSLSNSFVSKDRLFTQDLAIVTTTTTAVSTVCCLIAAKTWRRTIVYDEKNFLRTGLWIALFGMYCFIISSQLMVYFPGLCGQKFCLANAILVHWFALMSVAWTAVQTVRIIQVVRHPEAYERERSLSKDSYHGFRIKNWLAATLIPCLFPLLASMPEFSENLALLLGGYGYASHEKWCWLGDDNTWIPWVTFIVPVSLVALLNILAVILYVISTRKLQKDLAALNNANAVHGDPVKRRLYGVIINTGLMGCVWLSMWLALFSCVIDETETLPYVFVILLTVACGSQAVYLVLFEAIIPGKQKKRRKECDNYAKDSSSYAAKRT